MQLTKHHALGNDFLVTFVDEVPDDAPETARALCDRRTGVGADGLLIGIDDGLQPIMRLFNSDGSSAEVSGRSSEYTPAAPQHSAKESISTGTCPAARTMSRGASTIRWAWRKWQGSCIATVVSPAGSVGSRPAAIASATTSVMSRTRPDQLDEPGAQWS